MLSFDSLASSSDGCCYRLSGGGASAPLLLDAGIRYELIQRGLDFQVTSLAGCLLTHTHGDHAKSVKDLLRNGVNVYASELSWRSLAGQQRAKHRAIEVYPREPFSVGDWGVMPFEAIHDAPGTLGFVIDSPHRHRLLFLTDSAYSPYTFPGLTHVAIEANFSNEIIRESATDGRVNAERYRRTHKTHMSLETLIRTLKANDLSKVEKIWLLHLSSDNSDEAGFKRAIEEATGIPTEVCAEKNEVPF